VRGRRRSGRADSGRRRDAGLAGATVTAGSGTAARRWAPVLRRRSFDTAALQLARENMTTAALTRRRRQGLDSLAPGQGSSFGQELRSGSFMPACAAGGCRPRCPMEARHLATESPTGGPHVSVIFKFQKNSKILFRTKKNRYMVRKKSGKIDGGRKSNLEHFFLLQLPQILHEF
jgi:hypothetical protein